MAVHKDQVPAGVIVPLGKPVAARGGKNPFRSGLKVQSSSVGLKAVSTKAPAAALIFPSLGMRG